MHRPGAPCHTSQRGPEPSLAHQPFGVRPKTEKEKTLIRLRSCCEHGRPLPGRRAPPVRLLTGHR